MATVQVARVGWERVAKGEGLGGSGVFVAERVVAWWVTDCCPLTSATRHEY